MESHFVRLRLKGGEATDRDHAVNVAQIVSIIPFFSESNRDPTTDSAEALVFSRARPKDDAEATTTDLRGHFEVVDSIGNRYWSAIGKNDANELLGKIYDGAAD
jgi:hypothetical protein